MSEQGEGQGGLFRSLLGHSEDDRPRLEGGPPAPTRSSEPIDLTTPSPAAERELIADLTGADPSARTAALETLLRSTISPRVALAVARALSDPRPETRRLALQVLERTPTLAPIEALIAVVTDNEPSVRAAALATLGRTGRASVLTTIQERLLAESEGGVVDAGLAALGQLLQTVPRPFPESTLDGVCRTVGQLGSARRSGHRAELGLIARVVREEDLIARFRAGTDPVRIGAAALALERETSGCLQMLANLTSDPQHEIKDLAMEAGRLLRDEQRASKTLSPGFDVGRFGRRVSDVQGRSRTRPAVDPRTRPSDTSASPPAALGEPSESLFDALGSADPITRASAARSLTEIEPERLAEWTEAFLEDPSPGAAGNIAGLVAEHGRVELVPYLLRALLELPDGAERSRVAHVLAPLDVTWGYIETLLEDGSSTRRLRGAQLTRLLDPDRTAPVLHALRDTQAAVRMEALEGLGELGPGEVAERVLEIVSSDASAPARLAAVRAFARAEPGLKVQAATIALESNDRAVRVAALDLLTEGSDEELSLLARALQHSDLYVARKAIEGLGALRAPESLAILWNALRSAAAEVREPILDAMSRFDRDAVVFLGRQALDSVDEGDRVLGISVLARLEGSASNRLLDALEDPSVRVREQALAAIRDDPRAAAVIPVGARLRDPEPKVRLAALEVLALIEDDRTLPYFVDGAKDPAREVRRAAKEALLSHSSDAVIELLLRALAFPSHRKAAADILAEIGAPAIDRLISVLPEADAQVRDKVGEILRAADAVPSLIERLTARDPEARLRAVTGLGAVGAKDAVQGLIGRLQDPDGSVRAAAARVLGSLGDRSAIEPLKAAFISDPDMEVVRAIEPALRHLTGDDRPGDSGN